MTISIVIPVYNEEERLDKTFKAFSELQISRGLKLEKVIFVDDGSEDNSKFKIQNSKPKLESQLKTRVKIVSYKKNRGKGYAVKQGMKLSSSDYTLFMDADISTHPNQLIKFIPYMKKNTPIIIGTRKNGISTVVIHQPLYRELLGRGYTSISNFLLDTEISDFTCGFKMFSKQAKDRIFSRINIDGWGFDAETMYLAKKFGLAVAEVPVRWEDRLGSKVDLYKDLPKSFLDLIQIRLNSSFPRLLSAGRSLSPVA